MAEYKLGVCESLGSVSNSTLPKEGKQGGF